MLDRRTFLKTSMATASFALLSGMPWNKAWAWYQSQQTPLWQTGFRGVGPGGISVALPDSGTFGGAAHYSLNIGQFTDQIHPTLGRTTLWGYNPVTPLGSSNTHLGGIIVASKGNPVQLTFTNNLPANHIIPVDTTIDGAQLAQNRTAVHLHGGFVPWTSDGGPHAWFTPSTPANAQPDGITAGLSFLNGGANVGQANHYYPMQQSARLMWYHDHAVGITRINAYAGIASALVLRDGYEGNLRNLGLPEYVENSLIGNKTVQELPIVVQDKIFVGPDIGTVDKPWVDAGFSSSPGSLWYAHQYDTARYGKLGPTPSGPPPAISCVPEFFGDTMLANGTVYPQANVEARRYRFRILNACNARFLNLQMYVDDGSPNGITLNNAGNPANAPALNNAALNPAGKPTPNFLVLGTEGGFLPKVQWVPSGIPFNGTVTGGSLLLAPAERADVIFDFKGYAGKKIVLYTDTPAPFPGGDPRNDYFPGLNPNKNPVNGVTLPGNGPNTRVIMRFNVGGASSADAPLSIARNMDLSAGNDTLPVTLGSTALPAGVPVRQLTLNETFDLHGRLIQMLGTNLQMPGGGYGQAYSATSTENVSVGATEVWQIANLTADTHPIHFHLVNVQIISRQPFSGYKNGVANLTGAPLPPALNENGWKETVRMNPGEVTTVIMKFNLPTVPFNVPLSPRTGGNEYVWHCHILEHEEHDMMRPLVVT